MAYYIGQIHFKLWYPRYQVSWGKHGAHLGPVGPRWAPYWPHEPCYQGHQSKYILREPVIITIWLRVVLLSIMLYFMTEFFANNTLMVYKDTEMYFLLNYMQGVVFIHCTGLGIFGCTQVIMQVQIFFSLLFTCQNIIYFKQMNEYISTES